MVKKYSCKNCFLFFILKNERLKIEKIKLRFVLLSLQDLSVDDDLVKKDVFLSITRLISKL